MQKRVYHEDHADEQDESWEELEAQWNQPCCIGLGFAGAADVVRSCAGPLA